MAHKPFKMYKNCRKPYAVNKTGKTKSVSKNRLLYYVLKGSKAAEDKP